MSPGGLIPTQVISFLWSVAVGAGLGLLYDAFRILRLALPSPGPVVAAQDILFGLIAAIVSFGVMLTVTEGKLRLFLLIGEAVGWALYYGALSSAVMAAAEFIIAVVRSIIGFIWGIVYGLGQFFHRIFIQPALALVAFIRAQLSRLLAPVKQRTRQHWHRARNRAQHFGRQMRSTLSLKKPDPAPNIPKNRPKPLPKKNKLANKQGNSV
jgi:spore cortex biosynthesis protein YabQ